MWVVKLGGSLTRDRGLLDWLHMLAEYGGGRVTVVPGGAEFSEMVREVQQRWKFDDLAAHNMATLAMVQTALMLHSLEPRLVLAAQDSEIRRALHAGRPALWMPYTALRDTVLTHPTLVEGLISLFSSAASAHNVVETRGAQISAA